MRALLIGLAACGRLDFDPREEGFTFTGFTDCPPAIALVGTAACSAGALVITPDVQNQHGAAWFATPFRITPTTRLSIAVTLAWTSADPTPADGMAIVLSADPRGPAAIGDLSQGEALSYGDITPSAALELDDASNADVGDIDDDHLGIDRDGSLVSIVQHTAMPLNLGAAGVFTAWLDYDGPSSTLTGYVSATAAKPIAPLVTGVDDLTRLGSAWVGLTGATGNDRQQERVLAWSLDVRQ